MTIDFLARARRTLRIESDAVRAQTAHIDRAFADAVRLIAACCGRVVVMGLGKSGIVGRKIAATMSSVGIPSVFLHPAESLHGDLGMLMPGDVVLMLSYTGETEEIKKVMPVLRRMDMPIVVMTGRVSAPAWKQATYIINARIRTEACPYNLAPTASTTAMLALGDALALAASALKGFKPEQFARFHPDGGLGKRLTMTVSDIMRRGKELPIIEQERTVSEALLVMTRTRLGAACVVDRTGCLAGFFTDGDLRRRIQKDRALLSRRLSAVMTRDPLTIAPGMLAAEAARILKKHSFDNIPIVGQDGRPVGVLDERDLLAAGIT